MGGHAWRVNRIGGGGVVSLRLAVVVLLAGLGCSCDRPGADMESASRDPAMPDPMPEPASPWRVVQYTDRMTDVTHKTLFADGEARSLTLAIRCPVLNQRDDLLLNISFRPLGRDLYPDSGDAISVSTRFDKERARTFERWFGGRTYAQLPFDQASTFVTSMTKHDRLLATVHQSIGESREDTFLLTGFREAIVTFLADCPPRCVGLKAPGDRDASCKQPTLGAFERIAEGQ